MTGVAAHAEWAEEDAARASLYALIGRLFYLPPDAALLVQIARDAALADTSTALGAAWHALGALSRDAGVESLREEHLALFGGVGKAIVTPYTSAYATHTLHERHLLALRQELAKLGLSRTEHASDPEDHVAGLCDAMRHLIMRQQSEQLQRAFFNDFMSLSIARLCERLLAAAPARFYKQVAHLTLAFLDVERESFEMLE